MNFDMRVCDKCCHNNDNACKRCSPDDIPPYSGFEAKKDDEQWYFKDPKEVMEERWKSENIKPLSEPPLSDELVTSLYKAFIGSKNNEAGKEDKDWYIKALVEGFRRARGGEGLTKEESELLSQFTIKDERDERYPWGNLPIPNSYSEWLSFVMDDCRKKHIPVSDYHLYVDMVLKACLVDEVHGLVERLLDGEKEV